MPVFSIYTSGYSGVLVLSSLHIQRTSLTDFEFKNGVRYMVLYTMSKEHEEFAIRRLKNQKISYMIQEVGTNKINLFFGKAECMEAMRHIIIRPLNQLTAEEDFILGAMLGYDLCQQCKRYCSKKEGIKMAV